MMADAPRVVENLFAPDLFADDAMAISILNGAVRLTFTTTKWTQHPAQEAARVVVGRLVLPIPAAQRLAVTLNDFLTQRGLSPTSAVTAGEPMN